MPSDLSPKVRTDSPNARTGTDSPNARAGADSPKARTDSPNARTGTDSPKASAGADSPKARAFSPKVRTDSIIVPNIMDAAPVDGIRGSEEKRSRLSVSLLLNSCRDSNATLLIPLNNNDLKRLELLVAAAISRFEKIREAVLADINFWMNSVPIWEHQDVRTVKGSDSPKPWDGLRRNRGEAGERRISARRNLLEEKLLKNLPSEADLILVRIAMEKKNETVDVDPKPLAAEDSVFLFQAILEEREGRIDSMCPVGSTDLGGSTFNSGVLVRSDTENQSKESDNMSSKIGEEGKGTEGCSDIGVAEGINAHTNKEKVEIKSDDEYENEKEEEKEEEDDDEGEEEDVEDEEEMTDEKIGINKGRAADDSRTTSIQLMRDSLQTKIGLANSLTRTQNGKVLSIIVPSYSTSVSKLPTPVPPYPSVVRAKRTDLSSLAKGIIYPDLRALDREMRFRSTVTSSLSSGLLALAKSNGIIFTPPPPSSSFQSHIAHSQSNFLNPKIAASSSPHPLSSASPHPPSSASSTASTPRRLLLAPKGNIFNTPETDEEKRKRKDSEKRVESEGKKEEEALLLMMKPMGAILDGTLVSALSWQYRYVHNISICSFTLQ